MILKNRVIVFDIDDTLYKEIDFLKSGYKAIVKSLYNDFLIKINFKDIFDYYKQKINVFEKIIEKYNRKEISIDYLLNIYRNHFPDIEIENSVLYSLQKFKSERCILGIISDGRSFTQRNKLKALGIIDLFDDVIISEEFGTKKPNENNYLFFEKKYPHSEYFYIGDNIQKDFVTPNILGWRSIGIKDIHKQNIHQQNEDVTDDFLPNLWVNNIEEIVKIIICE